MNDKNGENMINHQVHLTLTNKQIQKLKSLNQNIIHHLEEKFGLRLNILDELKNELYAIVKSTPELINVMEKINKDSEY